ncbi:MAG: hypothetical protein ACRDP1_07720 [Nocardioidaceae bacterium]
MSTSGAPHSRFNVGELVTRLLVTAALVADAVVHLRLAGRYAAPNPGGLTETTIFRIEAVTALVIAAYVLVRGSRPAYLLAALVAASAFAAVVVYRYVNVAAIGPIPPMYDPLWFFEKSLSAVAEAAGAVLALVGFALSGPPVPRGNRISRD